MKVSIVVILLLLLTAGSVLAGYYAGSHQYVYSTLSNGDPERYDPSTGKAWVALDGKWMVLHNKPLFTQAGTP
jgi:ABC-type cobalt transport system substrate-binding protein